MIESVGEQLRNAREARKLSLEQVYKTTRINVRYLKSLEDDQHPGLPSNVQAKGFLRLYADYLDLPVQTLLDAWEGKLPPEPPPPEPEPIEGTAPEETAPDPQEETEDLVESEPEEEPVAIIIDTVPPGEDETTQPPSELIPASDEIFVEIGQQLKERRESLGLSLGDVEHYTRLRQHYLRAMEDGRTKDLPSLVQGRGMLSNYARFLELDAEALLLRFAEALQERRIEKLPPKPQPRFFSRRRKVAVPVAPAALKRLITPDLLIGGSVILVLLGFAIWGAAQVSAMRSQSAVPTVLPIANLLAVTASPQPSAETGTAQPAVAAAAPAQGGSDANAVATQPPPGEVTPTSIPVIGDAPIQVYVIANQRAWMQVSEDGKVKFNGRVVPGNAYPFSGKTKIELVSGNAAALQVFFNQTDLGSLGINEQVVRLIFTAKGILTPTPSFSATPTTTAIPSLTPKPSPTQATPTITPFVP